MAKIKIALAGNPNSGKTTLFNALTGAHQYVGNWPGVTVEKKEGHLKGNSEIVIEDLPGIYSLSPYTIEEKVTRRFLVEESPDAILNIVDGTNIDRNLYLSTQLSELGIPMVMAVNMMDVVRRNGDTIDFAKIAKALRCEVVGISAASGEGIDAAAERALALANANEGANAADLPRRGEPPRRGESPHVFTGSVEHALAHIEESIQGLVPKSAIRWYAIKIFEHDRDVINTLKIPVGLLKHIEEHIRDCEAELEDDSESIITTQRYEYIQGLMDKALTRNQARKNKATMSDRIDKIVTSRVWGVPIFLLAISLMWFLAVAHNGPGTLLTDWANDVLLGDWIGGALRRALAAAGANATVLSLVVDGAWGGVSTVLGFVPVITIVFLFLAFLEDCGYMARVAFIMDGLFRKFGLSGRSFIPMIVGKGCGVPAVMAARSIENERDRRMTAILVSFIPCSAKTVLIALFASLFFREMWYVAPMMDFIGILIIVLGGIALKKSRPFAGDASPFIMELPAYHLPTLRGVLTHTWNNVRGFVVKAGLVIFPACVFLWFVMHFDWRLTMVGDQIELSILHDVCASIAWLFAPLGFGSWQGAAATISAEIAKEQSAATLALVAGSDEGIIALFRSFSPYPALSAFSFLVFNMFIPPCIVAVVATFREMGLARWGWFAVAFQMFVGYTLALSAFQLGSLFCGGGFGFWTALTIALDLAVLWAIVRPASKPPRDRDDISGGDGRDDGGMRGGKCDSGGKRGGCSGDKKGAANS